MGQGGTTILLPDSRLCTWRPALQRASSRMDSEVQLPCGPAEGAEAQHDEALTQGHQQHEAARGRSKGVSPAPAAAFPVLLALVRADVWPSPPCWVLGVTGAETGFLCPGTQSPSPCPRARASCPQLQLGTQLPSR